MGWERTYTDSWWLGHLSPLCNARSFPHLWERHIDKLLWSIGFFLPSMNHVYTQVWLKVIRYSYSAKMTIVWQVVLRQHQSVKWISILLIIDLAGNVCCVVLAIFVPNADNPDRLAMCCRHLSKVVSNMDMTSTLTHPLWRNSIIEKTAAHYCTGTKKWFTTPSPGNK